jgi:hypothetical protein
LLVALVAGEVAGIGACRKRLAFRFGQYWYHKRFEHSPSPAVYPIVEIAFLVLFTGLVSDCFSEEKPYWISLLSGCFQRVASAWSCNADTIFDSNFSFLKEVET